MNLSYSQIVTSFTIYEFLSELTKPFTQMDIYKAGIIDSNGKFLKDPEDYKTQQEMKAGNAFYRLIVVLKRALRTSSDPMVRYAMTNPMAALTALSEEVSSMGGDEKVFLDYMTPIIEEMSVGGGGIVGVGVSADKPEDVVVTPKSAEAHKRRVKRGAKKVGRKLFEHLLLEAKRVVETTGHVTHIGDFLYRGKPELAFKHLTSVHKRFRGIETPDHLMSLKADGGMSVVGKKHKNGKIAVAYKGGAEEFTDPSEIARTGKEHFVRDLTPFLHIVSKMDLKPGTAVQGDLLFTSGHRGTVQPNTITYEAPHGAQIGFAPHSQYATDGLDLRKTSSHPDHSRLKAEGAFIPNLAITRETKLSLTPERHKIITNSIASAKKALRQKGTMSFLRKLPRDEKFHRMLQEYSNHAARTSGERSVKGLIDFVGVHMGKASQKKLSEKTKKARIAQFTKTINDNAHHFEAVFTAHGHFNTAKHAILDQFREHDHQFELKTHRGEEHEGIMSILGKPGPTETQAKFVREGPGGFPEKNVKNAIIRFGKPPEA